MYKIDCIIPVYNEEVSVLEKVLSDIHEVPVIDKIIVVDDGSPVEKGKEYDFLTRKILGERGKYVMLEKNTGKESAVRTGLLFTSGEYILLQDADLEYPVKNVFALIKELPADMVVARRFVPIDRVTFSGVLANKIITRLIGIPDVFSGQRIVKREILEKALSKGNFTLETKLTLYALSNNLNVKFVDVFYYPRSYAEGKKAKYYHMLPILLEVFKWELKKALSNRKSTP